MAEGFRKLAEPSMRHWFIVYFLRSLINSKPFLLKKKKKEFPLKTKTERGVRRENERGTEIMCGVVSK